MMENEKTSRLFLFIVILVLSSASLLFSFFGIHRSFWFDECCSVEIANTSWTGIIANLKANAHTPPLYYFLLKPWMALFGTGEAAARSLSAVFYVFSLFAIYFLGKTLYDQKTALLSAFLFMANPMVVQFAQFARMYSLLSLLAILSTLFFIRQFYSGRASKMNLAALVIVNIAGTFTHYWFFFLLLAQGVAYLWLFSKSSLKSFMLAMLASVAPFFALWTPILLVQMTNGGTSEITRPGISTLANTLLIFWGGGKKAALLYAVFFTLILLDVQGLKTKFRSLSALKEFLLEKPTLIFLTILVFSLGVPWIISQFKPIYQETKYTILALFTVIMLTGSLLGRFANRFLVFAFCAALLLAVTAGLVIRRSAPPVVSPQSITEYLLQHAQKNDILILATSSLTGTDYYLKRAGAENRFVRFPFPAEMARHPCWPNLNRWRNEKILLDEEAGRIANRSDSLLKAGGGKIWFLAGHLPEFDGVIKNKLDARFQPVDEKLLGESYPPIRHLIHAYQRNSRPKPVSPAGN